MDRANRVGTLLWEMRTAGGWSQGQLARLSGVSKAALSQWESGARLPRIPELEAVLSALQANAAQRARVFAHVEAPRALRRLRQSAEINGMGAPPVVGNLLRAMRLRKGWTQEQTAQSVRVVRSTVARWEQGERIPTTTQLHTLCFALGAREEELVAITTGALVASSKETTTWEAKEAELTERLQNVLTAPADLKALKYLSLQRETWDWATRTEAARPLLGRLYAHYATYCRNMKQWSEAEASVRQALALVSRQQEIPDVFLRSLLAQGAALVHGGSRPAPERGLLLLQPWVRQSVLPTFTAWILSDMATYATMEGQIEAGLRFAQEACQAAERSGLQIEIYLRRYDYGQLLVEAGQPATALRVLPFPDGSYSTFNRARVMLVFATAYHQLGSRLEAHDWLQQAFVQITAHNHLPGLKAKADALAEQL